MTDKERINVLREGICRLTDMLDVHWTCAWLPSLSEEAHENGLAQYRCFTAVIELLGGDWKRDKNGRHRVFIAGVTADTEVNCDED